MFHEEARKFEDLIPDISARAPKADTLTIEHVARQATLDFMRETRIFHDRVVFYGQRGVAEYILEIPDNQVMIDILPDGMTMNGRPYRAFRRDGHYNVVRLMDTAVDGACYEVDYSFHIKPDTCDIPNEVYDKYLHAIVDRAVMMLFTGDNDGYVSNASYQIASRNYDRELDMIASRRMHNFSNGRPRMIKRSSRSQF